MLQISAVSDLPCRGNVPRELAYENITHFPAGPNQNEVQMADF